MCFLLICCVLSSLGWIFTGLGLLWRALGPPFIKIHKICSPSMEYGVYLWIYEDWFPPHFTTAFQRKMLVDDSGQGGLDVNDLKFILCSHMDNYAPTVPYCTVVEGDSCRGMSSCMKLPSKRISLDMSSCFFFHTFYLECFLSMLFTLKTPFNNLYQDIIQHGSTQRETSPKPVVGLARDQASWPKRGGLHSAYPSLSGNSHHNFAHFQLF